MKEEIKDKLFKGQKFNSTQKVFYLYYILENINLIFGKTEFAPDEITITESEKGIYIDSIFDIKLNIYIVSTQLGTNIVGRVNGNSSFILSSFNKVIKNEILNDVNGVKEKIEYECDVNNEKYIYAKTTISDNPEEGYYFKALLSPTGAVITNNELYEMIVEIPEPVKEKKSLLATVKENYDSFIYIPCCENIEDSIPGIDQAFTKLKEKAEECKKTKGLEQKKD